MTFRIGQKVVCVDDDFGDGSLIAPANLPRKNSIYTLRDPFSANGWTWWRVTEIVNPPSQCLSYGIMEPAFAPWHFRPAVERKTDISVFTEMLGPQRELALTAGNKTS